MPVRLDRTVRGTTGISGWVLLLVSTALAPTTGPLGTGAGGFGAPVVDAPDSEAAGAELELLPDIPELSSFVSMTAAAATVSGAAGAAGCDAPVSPDAVAGAPGAAGAGAASS